MEPETVPRVAEGGAAGINGGGGLELEAYREDLVPGIPDNITLKFIVSGLTWKKVESLASECPAWCLALQSRKLYDDRAFYRGRLESLFVLRTVFHEFDDTLALYSTRDGFCFQLPPLPVCERGVPNDCRCVTTDGKIFTLGGALLDFSLVFVLDLAGLREWK